MNYTFVTPCYFGTESTAAFEVRRLGAENVQVSDGRIRFEGNVDLIAAANINLRCAERVLLLLASYKATTFDELFDGVYSIPWEELLPKDAAFPVKGSSLSSTLSSVPACQSIVKKAIVKRLMKGHSIQTLPETGSQYQIRVALRKDIAEIFLDTSGDGLHKRGYRKNSNAAPLKETLAAAIADLARVRQDSKVFDPFCGSGTLIIEATQKALHMAPGLRRRFAAEKYAFVPEESWRKARSEALAAIKKDVEFTAVGTDIDPIAISLAQKNARLAGVAEYCRFEVADVADFTPPAEALILTNPPYGERLGDLSQAVALEKTLGNQWKKNPTTGCYVITADSGFEQNFGKKANRRRKLYNGMIPCQVYMYY